MKVSAKSLSICNAVPKSCTFHTSRGLLDSLSLSHSLPSKKNLFFFNFIFILNRSLKLFKNTFIMGISLVPQEMVYFVYCCKSIGEQVSLQLASCHGVKFLPEGRSSLAFSSQHSPTGFLFVPFSVRSPPRVFRA